MLERVKSLEKVGQMRVPAVAKTHRFVTECLAAVRTMGDKGGVLGTDDSGVPELFGWQPQVKPHVDASGFVYFMPIIAQGGWVCANVEDTVIELPLRCGTVYRLDDEMLHWTRGDGLTVGLFVGSYQAPEDALAIALLADGLAALAAGLYDQAPRVGRDFRTVLHDECLVYRGETYTHRLLSEALRDAETIVQCAHPGCHHPAVVVDRYFPSFAHNSCCAAHVRVAGFEHI